MYRTPYVASLRVYEPLDLFDPIYQLRLSQSNLYYSKRQNEQFRSLIRSAQEIPLNLEEDGAYILEHEGKKYIAPWSTLFRCWLALEKFNDTLPESVVKFFIPDSVKQYLKNLNYIIEDNVSHIQTSNWHVPPRWFALYLPNERLRGVNRDGYYTIIRTSIMNAINRCTFTYQSILATFGEGIVEREVADLLEWLKIFDTKSIVELDYGGLASYLNKQLVDNGEVGLDADTSVEDVCTSITGLASGDRTLAAIGYERLVSRWRQVSALESAF